MQLVLPTEDEAREIFGVEDNDDVYTAAPLPDGVHARLLELKEHIPLGAKVIMARDWERCLVALVEETDWCDVLAFTDLGAVGHGGVNQPRYFDTVKELRADDERRQQTRTVVREIAEEPHDKVIVALSNEAYAVICGMVAPTEEGDSEKGVWHAGVISDAWDEIREKFPVDRFWDAVKAGKVEYDSEAGL